MFSICTTDRTSSRQMAQDDRPIKEPNAGHVINTSTNQISPNRTYANYSSLRRFYRNINERIFHSVLQSRKLRGGRSAIGWQAGASPYRPPT